MIERRIVEFLGMGGVRLREYLRWLLLFNSEQICCELCKLRCEVLRRKRTLLAVQFAQVLGFHRNFLLVVVRIYFLFANNAHMTPFDG